MLTSKFTATAIKVSTVAPPSFLETQFPICYPPSAINGTNVSSLISTSPSITKFASNYYILGILIACLSPACNAVRFILIKRAHIQVEKEGGVSAANWGFGYCFKSDYSLSNLFIAFAWYCNFVGFILASPLTVELIEGLSDVVTALLAIKAFGEKINAQHIYGAALCLLGSTLLICLVPKEITVIERLHDLYCCVSSHWFMGLRGHNFTDEFCLDLHLPSLGQTCSIQQT